ncbi:MAG: hypothetical protein ACTS78_01860 [Arsenophonus sp. NC-WZS1-MAG3]
MLTLRFPFNLKQFNLNITNSNLHDSLGQITVTDDSYAARRQGEIYLGYRSMVLSLLSTADSLILAISITD